MTLTHQPDVGLLEPDAVQEAGLVEQLSALINGVYEKAESGLWRDGTSRTTATEVAELIRAGQIAVASRNGRIAGSVRVHDVADDVSEFGLRAVQLELLVPRAWTHPSKEFLRAWYGRRGYRIVRTASFDDTYPQLAPRLATVCDLEIHQKRLQLEDRLGDAGA